MGSTPDGKNRVSEQLPLFPSTDLGQSPRKHFVLDTARIPTTKVSAPGQTNSKSRLIALYISKYQNVTQGGLFIDGFAAPQSREHEDAWTARRVLEVTPPRLRTLWLCDIDPDGIEQLLELKALHHAPPPRRVFVHKGDFNEIVNMVMKSTRLTPGAIFALLDQRNTECHWKTVETLAARKGKRKIELLYFVGSSWIHRSIKTATSPGRLRELDLWWGCRGWKDLFDLSQEQVVEKMAERFEDELGYNFVNAYPIYQTDDGKKALFYLIHASDHREAPKLMASAYQAIQGDRAGSPVDSQGNMNLHGGAMKSRPTLSTSDTCDDFDEPSGNIDENP